MINRTTIRDKEIQMETTEKFWLKSYPEGMPAEVDVTQYQSLVQLLEEAFKKFSARNAYACMGKYLTYGKLDLMSQKVGAWLQQQGLKKAPVLRS
jgi:long-chain acyl-CoA synthetase